MMPGEYFLVVYSESGDETHFMLFNMDDFDFAQECTRVLCGRVDVPWEAAEDYMDKLRAKEVLPEKSFYLQTYCTEDWWFRYYNIVKIISIPEFGC